MSEVTIAMRMVKGPNELVNWRPLGVAKAMGRPGVHVELTVRLKCEGTALFITQARYCGDFLDLFVELEMRPINQWIVNLARSAAMATAIGRLITNGRRKSAALSL